ncbi:hypothetical protein [Streptomyces violascens]|uniref:Uncharacterized protein n=1 Tax=Streptomyces violascens TaxID=67381 RepID=A0ABQ3QL78_9ACTN|nr:hypothetical protein [Streptomyces violascens]GGU44714.1 hypothetical protein GCM10010289_76630 [Streptomyces violascens]GHI38033.1 hypothetical protein Sviol_24410 [Streptomyces violascens]
MGTDGGDLDDATRSLYIEAYTRWREADPLTLTLNRQDAWLVMTALQQARALPAVEAGGVMAARLEAVGRALQEQVCDVPELYTLAEAGWRRAR